MLSDRILFPSMGLLGKIPRAGELSNGRVNGGLLHRSNSRVLAKPLFQAYL